MPIDILMPSLSPTMKSGKISNWLKKEGDLIKNAEVILEIETDKAIMEYEAPKKGKIGKILIPDGAENVLVGTLIAVMLAENEECNIDEYIKSKNNIKNDPQEVKKEIITNNECKKLEKIENFDKKFISPLAKKIANQNNINYSNISGSGPNGRVVKNDIENILKSDKNISCSEEFTEIAISGMRKVIADRLLQSKLNSPHFYLSVECNFDNLLNARVIINKELETQNIKISINDFFVKAAAYALELFPDVRTFWAENKLKICNNIDISVAVSIDNGLITPIVKNVNKKSLVEISSEVKILSKKAKEGGLKPSEYQGGCFTISNMGMFDVNEFFPIINPPQSAILGICTPFDKVILDDKGNVKNTKQIKITMSADHRVIDGVVATKFLNKIKNIIENPVIFSVS